MKIRLLPGTTLKDVKGKTLGEPGDTIDVDETTAKALVEGRSADVVKKEG